MSKTLATDEDQAAPHLIDVEVLGIILTQNGRLARSTGPRCRMELVAD